MNRHDLLEPNRGKEERKRVMKLLRIWKKILAKNLRGNDLREEVRKWQELLKPRKIWRNIYYPLRRQQIINHRTIWIEHIGFGQENVCRSLSERWF